MKSCDVKLKGFELTGNRDSINVDPRVGFRVRIGTISISEGNLQIEFIQSKKVPEGMGSFLPSKIKSLDGKMLWDFKEINFSGRVHLIYLQGYEYVLVFVNANRIFRVIPVQDLLKVKKIKAGEEIIEVGGTLFKDLIEIKKKAAKQMGVEIFLTSQEREFFKLIEEKEIRDKAEREKIKEEARRRRLEELLSRQNITVFGPNGEKLYGTPAKEDEWRMLPHRQPVILVDDESQPIEAFFVKKNGRGSEKVCAKPAYVEVPLREKISESGSKIQVLGMKTFFFGEMDIRQIPHFPAGIMPELVKGGLDGVVAAIGNPDKEGRLMVGPIGKDPNQLSLMAPL